MRRISNYRVISYQMGQIVELHLQGISRRLVIKGKGPVILTLAYLLVQGKAQTAISRLESYGIVNIAYKLG